MHNHMQLEVCKTEARWSTKTDPNYMSQQQTSILQPYEKPIAQPVTIIILRC
jgi:hypothetical protein